MNVRLRLFAVMRTTLGRSHVELELPDGATVAQLRSKLAEDYPALAPLLPTCLFAINGNYARDEQTIPSDSEVACIPPVSGG